MHKIVNIHTLFTDKYGVSTVCIHTLDANNLLINTDRMTLFFQCPVRMPLVDKWVSRVLLIYSTRFCVLLNDAWRCLSFKRRWTVRRSCEWWSGMDLEGNLWVFLSLSWHEFCGSDPRWNMPRVQYKTKGEITKPRQQTWFSEEFWNPDFSEDEVVELGDREVPAVEKYLKTYRRPSGDQDIMARLL